MIAVSLEKAQAPRVRSRHPGRHCKAAVRCHAEGDESRWLTRTKSFGAPA